MGDAANEKKKRGWRQRVLSWLVAVVVIYVVWAGAVYFMQTGMLFPVGMIGGRPALVLTEGMNAERVEVPGPGAPVETLVLHRAVGARGEPGAVVIVFHGNAELARDYLGDRLAEHLRGRGITVVAPEYRGYGTMPGKPGQSAIGADMVAVADWVKLQPWCDPEKVLYFGASVGGGVACALASEREPSAGLIVQSTFTSVASFAGRFFVPEVLVQHPFRNDRALERLEKPVLIIHGANDSVVPVAHGRALAKIARRGTYVELEGDHFYDWADWGAYLRAVDQWLGERGM